MNIFKIKLLSALLISFLIILIIGSYSFQAIAVFNDFKKVANPELKLTLDRYKFFLQNEIEKDIIKLTAAKVLKDDETPLKTFRITVDQKDIETLNKDLPTSGKDHFINAYMTVSDKEDKIYKIKMRYRGDNYYHWLFQQKSLRIKLAKDSSYNMAKSFNLINPPIFLQAVDTISYKISLDLGLIAPKYYYARVFINNVYQGVQIYLDQVDESLLRASRLMPGSIYYGEQSVIKENGIFDLWFDQKYWDKKASRNSEQKHTREDIKYFIKAITQFDTKEFYNFVETSINQDNYFCFIAIDRFTASQHHDFTHNHKIYFDPYKGKFEPIQWDIRFWNYSTQKDESLYPFLLKVTQNPIYDAKIDKILYNIIQKYPISEIKTLYENILKQTQKDLKSDIFKDSAGSYPKLLLPPYWYSKPFNNKDVVDQMNQDIQNLSKRVTYLKELLNSAKIDYFIEDNSLYFKISGNSPVSLAFTKNIDIIKKVYKQKEYKVKKEEILYSSRVLIKGGQTKHPKLIMGTDIVAQAPEIYRFKFDTNINIHHYLKSIIFTNHITGTKIDPKKSETNFRINQNTIHPWDFIEESKTKVLQGTINVTETLVFDKDTEVIIKPNTTFLMDEKSSIYFYGKVTAIGTKKKPIKFITNNGTKSWGSVVVQGKVASGSKFHYCHFENGSIDTKNLIRYTGQFNIHDLENFEVKNCFIGKNYLGDDSMHIAYAKGIVDSCTFDGAKSDALDIDISNVIISNNIFKNSGNDGLDIMTTNMKSDNNIFIGTGDKGISVGEWSEANITNSTFINTYIGLEIKDISKVTATNLKFINSTHLDINLYNKNKRYDKGGELYLNQPATINKNTLKIKADERSNYEIN